MFLGCHGGWRPPVPGEAGVALLPQLRPAGTLAATRAGPGPRGDRVCGPEPPVLLLRHLHASLDRSGCGRHSVAVCCLPGSFAGARCESGRGPSCLVHGLHPGFLVQTHGNSLLGKQWRQVDVVTKATAQAVPTTQHSLGQRFRLAGRMSVGDGGKGSISLSSVPTLLMALRLNEVSTLGIGTWFWQVAGSAVGG